MEKERSVTISAEEDKELANERLKRTQSRVVTQCAESRIPHFTDTEELGGVMDYNTRDLATWTTYTFIMGTMLQNVKCWWLMLRLVVMSCGMAFLLMYYGLKPEYIFHLNFGTMSRTLNVFVGIMLCFFLGSSVERWVNTVGGCMMLFDSIRNLNMQFHALGVHSDLIRKVTRYGLLSCEFLVLELHMRSLSKHDREIEAKKLFSSPELTGLIDWEKEIIENVFTEHQRVASQIWIWVASLIGRMAQDGDVPPMATPTYGRIMNLAQDAQEGIRQVRISMTVQMPFIYIHTLAFLVHVCNICAALDFGAHLARSISGMLWFYDIHWRYSDLLAKPVMNQSFTLCHQAIVAELMTSMVPAMMYQAFLQIGLILAQPFDEAFGPGISAIPTRSMIAQLRSDIKSAETFAECDGKSWVSPRFKQPAPAAK